MDARGVADARVHDEARLGVARLAVLPRLVGDEEAMFLVGGCGLGG